MIRTVDLRSASATPEEAARILRSGDSDATAETVDVETVSKVREIVRRVRSDGDQALIALTLELDGCDLSEIGIRVDIDEIHSARELLDAPLVAALEDVMSRAEAYQRHVLSALKLRTSSDRGGVFVEERRVPIDRVGGYVPGGRYPYPSTVLMLAAPAKVAGVGSLALAVPPGRDGSISSAVLAAAQIGGVDEIYRMGGAQAIAALAYGTESVAPVDLIAGPGNIYVELAKREVFGDVGIDLPAGPSELLVVADSDAPPEWVGIDVLAQAEHGAGGSCAVLTWDVAVATSCREAIEAAVSTDTREEIGEIVENKTAVGICSSPEQVVAVANAFAPEHIELMVSDPSPFLEGVTTAGAVFVGNQTPAAFGDYVAGPDHILPTGRSGRFASAVSVETFMRRYHVVAPEKMGIEFYSEVGEVVADAEGLTAHRDSLRLRRLTLEEGEQA